MKALVNLRQCKYLQKRANNAHLYCADSQNVAEAAI